MKTVDMFGVDDLLPVKGKSLAALAYSRQRRAEIMEMFGQDLPASIMRKRITSDRKDGDSAWGSYTETTNKYVSNDMSEAEKKAFGMSSSGVAYGALSLFPQNVGRTTLLLYSEPGDIVVDPFAGHNSRMEFCAREGRHYIGYDISERFMTANKLRASFLRAHLPGVELVLHHQDSRTMSRTRDELGDFTITSPPYYDIEDYGDEPGQLGKCPTYESFLDDIQLVMAENFRTLKSGAYSAWFVNDFRRDGRFYAYHCDTIDRMRAVGFVFHDIMIVDLGSSFREAFLNQIVEQRILPKRHEYGLIFRKP